MPQIASLDPTRTGRQAEDLENKLHRRCWTRRRNSNGHSGRYRILPAQLAKLVSAIVSLIASNQFWVAHQSTLREPCGFQMIGTTSKPLCLSSAK